MAAETGIISRIRNEEAEAALRRSVASLRPGWEALVGDALRRDAEWSGHVEVALIHADLGVALLGTEPRADAVAGLKRALDAAGFRDAFGGHPPIVYRVLPPPGLPLEEILDAAFSLEPAVALSGETAWVPAARNVLAPDGAGAAGAPERVEPTPPSGPTPAAPALPAQAEPGEAHRSRRQVAAPLLAAGLALAVLGGVAAALLPRLESSGPARTQRDGGPERTAASGDGGASVPGQPEPPAAGLGAGPAPGAPSTEAPDRPEPQAVAAVDGKSGGEPPPPDAAPPLPGTVPEDPGPLAGAAGPSPDLAPTDSLSPEPPPDAAPTPAASPPGPPPEQEASVARMDGPKAPPVLDPPAGVLDIAPEPDPPGAPPPPSLAAAPESEAPRTPAAPEAPEASSEKAGVDAVREELLLSLAPPGEGVAEAPSAPAAPVARPAPVPAPDAVEAMAAPVQVAPPPPAPPTLVPPPPRPPAHVEGPVAPPSAITAAPPPPAALAARGPEAIVAPSPAPTAAVSGPPPVEEASAPQLRPPPVAKRRNERQQVGQGPQPAPPAPDRCRSVVMSAQLGEEVSAADLALMRARCGGRQVGPQAR